MLRTSTAIRCIRHEYPLVNTPNLRRMVWIVGGDNAFFSTPNADAGNF